MISCGFRRFSARASSTWSKLTVPDRSFIELRGPDSNKLLQGLITNDINRLNESRCLATAFLNPKGRVLADALLFNFPTSEGEPGVLIETHSCNEANLLRHLTMYKLRASVKIGTRKNIKSDLYLHGEKVDTTTYGDSLLFNIVDPRSEHLGTKVISLVSDPSGPSDQGVEISSARACFDRYRYVHGILDGAEYNNLLPFECNMDLLNHISYKKGCYIGQELTARTNFKGVIRKRIVPFILNTFDKGNEMNNGPFDCLPKEVMQRFERSTIQSVAPRSIQVLPGDKLYLSQDSTSDIEASVGEVIATSVSQDMGLAMVKLECLYEGPQQQTKFITARSADTSGEHFSVISVFKPEWFVKLNPETGKPSSD